MNWFTQFWHELLNPHCLDCIREKQEAKICNSCEILKMELSLAHQDYKFLLGKMTEKPEEIKTEPPVITKPLVVPWKTKQQMLEKEDRVRAAAIRGAGKVKTTEELEKEIAK